MDADVSQFYERFLVRRTPEPATSDDPIRMVCFDMDGVLIDAGSSWVMVHRHFGVNNLDGLQKFLAGELDDEGFIRSDIEKWWSKRPDLNRDELESIFETPPYVEGAVETVEALHDAGIETAIVSGGVDLIANRIGESLGIPHVYANGFHYHPDGRLTGEGVVRTPLRDKGLPLFDLEKLSGVPRRNMISIGNSVPDTAMFDATGRSIAFHPEDRYTIEHATWCFQRGPLTQVLDPILAHADLVA